MAIGRKYILVKEASVYHCISRCVRQSFLCGIDRVTGKNYDHRKRWIKDRLCQLTQIFSIEILTYALMSNHQHLMLRTRPEILTKLTDEEVARRWLMLYPPLVSMDADSLNEQVQELIANNERIVELRSRLGSVSWFMKSINEHIARRANKEDRCKGRFWEGRFKCIRLDDDRAILSCMVYIDLNPVRAKISKSLDDYPYSGCYERIAAFKKNNFREDDKLWLCPIEQRLNNGRGCLPITFTEYISLLKETGALIKRDNKGCLANAVISLLDRAGIENYYWAKIVTDFSELYSVVAASYGKMHEVANSYNKKWLKGMSFSSKAYR